jgi:hypothetical protein
MNHEKKRGIHILETESNNYKINKSATLKIFEINLILLFLLLQIML